MHREKLKKGILNKFAWHLLESIRIFGLTGGIRYHIQYLISRRNAGAGTADRMDHLSLNAKWGGDIYYRPYGSDVLLIHSIIVWEGEYDISIDADSFDVILDLGANIGLFSLLYAWRYPDKRIVAVEPEHGNASILRKNLGQVSERATVVQSGIWWRRADLNLIDNGMDWGFSVREANGEGSISGIAIDTLIEDYGLEGRLLVKMDIEGTEKVLFEHIREQKWIDRTSCLIMEIHGEEGSEFCGMIQGCMCERGFAVRRRGENYIFTRKR